VYDPNSKIQTDPLSKGQEFRRMGLLTPCFKPGVTYLNMRKLLRPFPLHST
jgi:hypothetical protein